MEGLSSINIEIQYMQEIKAIEEFYDFINKNNIKEDIYDYYNNNFYKYDLFKTFIKTFSLINETILSSESLTRLKDALKFLHKTYKSGYKSENLDGTA